MARIARNVETSRLTLEMALGVRKQLEHLRDRTQADSLAEVIRRALAVYDYLHAEKEKGAKLILKVDGGERELVLL
jgi:hypothetical protein